MRPLRRFPPCAALALALLALPALAGCAGPEPEAEIVGSTGIAFTYRPVGAQEGDAVVWTARVANRENTTSAPATLHLSVRSSVTGLKAERSVPIAPLPPRGTADLQVRTPYDGFGDYSGVGEVRVRERVIARALIFYEKCPTLC